MNKKHSNQKTNRSQSATFKRNRGIIFKDIEGTVYILDHRTDTIHTLNDTASFIWRILGKPLTVSALTQRVSGEYAVDVRQAKHDVAAFISNYVKKGLLIRTKA